MSGPRVLVMSRAILRILRAPPGEFDYICLDDHADRDAFLTRDGAGIAAILCSGMERLDAACIAPLPDLRLIAVVAAGMAGINLGAALDGFDGEPIDGSGWVEVPNVLMAPHVAGATVESLAAVMQGAPDNIRRHVAGELLERRFV